MKLFLDSMNKVMNMNKIHSDKSNLGMTCIDLNLLYTLDCTLKIDQLLSMLQSKETQLSIKHIHQIDLHFVDSTTPNATPRTIASNTQPITVIVMITFFCFTGFGLKSFYRYFYNRKTKKAVTYFS